MKDISSRHSTSIIITADNSVWWILGSPCNLRLIANNTAYIEEAYNTWKNAVH